VSQNILTISIKNVVTGVCAVRFIGKILPDSQIPSEKLSAFLVNSQEKADRLTHKINDVSSYQSRNPEKSRYGGGIRCIGWVFSFSGLPELPDEALMLTCAVRLDIIDIQEAESIAAISDNPYLTAMLQ